MKFVHQVQSKLASLYHAEMVTMEIFAKVPSVVMSAAWTSLTSKVGWIVAHGRLGTDSIRLN